MTIKPVRILALALAALGCGAQLSWGQQFQYSPVQSPATTGVDPFAPGGMPQEPGPQPSTPYWHQTPPGAYFNQVNNEGYVDPNQPDSYGEMSYGGGGEYGGDCGHGHCGSGCCNQGCYIYTRAEVFVLTRGISDDQVYSRDAATGATLSGRDLDFEYEPGIRGVVGVPVSEHHTVEGIYFGQHEWADSQIINSSGNSLTSFYNNFGFANPFVVVPGFDFANRHQITYFSEIDSAEINVQHSFPVRNCKQTAYLSAGARYFQLKEGFELLSQSPFTSNGWSRTRTENDMVGFQLGAGGHHFVKSNFRVSGDAKAALMVNWAEQNNNVTILETQYINENVRDEDLALLADGGVSLCWDITPWASVTGGYRVFYVDGVALATENINGALVPPDGDREPTLNNKGSVLYHGATAGFEIRW